MSTFLRILGLSRGVRRRLALGAAIALAVIAANIALLSLAGWFITAMAAAGLAGATLNYFTPAAGIRAFAIVRTLGRYLERLVNHDATLRVLGRLRTWVYARIEPLAPAGLARFRRGDLLSRLVSDVDALDEVYLRVLIPVAVAVVGTAAAASFLACVAPAIVPVESGLLATVGLVLPLLTRRLAKSDGARAADASAALKAELLDGLNGLSELTVFGAGVRHREAVARLAAELNDAQLRTRRLDAGALALGALAAGSALWLAFVLLAAGGKRVPTDPLVLPLVLFFVLSSAEIVQGLPTAFGALGYALAAGRRIFELTDVESPVREPTRPVPAPAGFGLELEGVRFRYAAAGPWVLSDIDLQLPEGGRIALVGPSGAGKSSLAHLLLRFWNVQEGEIRLGGRPVAAYASADVRARIAYVAQSTRLFSTTLRHNLLLGRPQASDPEIFAALELARIADEVTALPRGLDTFVGEGGMRLSTGQARRIMLARALLKRAPILLLDEPAEGLDPPNERALLDTLTAPDPRRSLILITHRPGGLERMDEILVLDRGRVVQRGSHRELLSVPGFYRDMSSYFAA